MPRLFTQTILLVMTLLSVGVFTHTAFAQQDFIPLAPIDTGGAGGESFTGCSALDVSGSGDFDATGKWVWSQKPGCLPKYLRTLYNTGVALAGLFLVFSIVRGGFELMWTDSILGKLEGKKIILQALGGAVIVYSSYLLMNVINPQLADDLNLALDFPRVQVKTVPVELQPVMTLTDQQFELLKKATARRDDELKKEEAGLLVEAGKLQEQADATTDPEEKERLLSKVAEKKMEAAQTGLTRVVQGAENLTVGEALKADTQQEIAAAVANATKSGGGIQQIRDAYTKARTELASDPAQVLALYKKEMEDIAGIQKHLAFAIIDNPPKRAVGPKGAVSIKEDILTQQLSEQINAIISERDKQKGALFTFNAAHSELGTQIQAQMRAVEGVATKQICQIKSKCRNNNYSYDYTKTQCENLRPDITCVY